MLFQTISSTKWVSLLMLIVILMAVTGPVENAFIVHADDILRSPAEHDAAAAISKNEILRQKKQVVQGKITHKLQSIPFSAPPQAVSHKEKGRVQIASHTPINKLSEYKKNFPFLTKDVSKFEAVEVVATGYTAGLESTGKSPDHPEYGITYSGIKVRKATVSTVAADPSVFPIGTLLYIPGYGYGVVADTGSAIKGKKLDLYYETKKDVYEQWGKKKVKVIIIERGDGNMTEKKLDSLNEAFSEIGTIPSLL